jgi:hypothetical protein
MNYQLGKSLRDTIVKSELPSLIREFGEIGVDSFLDEGLLKEIPVLSAILAVGKTAGSIRDFLFTKKLFRFLSAISTLNPAERANLIERLDQEPNFRSYTGERLMDLLSRLDEEQKPYLVGTALKLYAKKIITSDQLQRINHAIERFLLCDLHALRDFCAEGSKTRPTDGNPVTANFVNAGLGYVSSGFGQGGVHPTETAKLLLKVVDEGEI